MVSTNSIKTILEQKQGLTLYSANYSSGSPGYDSISDPADLVAENLRFLDLNL